MWLPLADYEGIYEIDENNTVRRVQSLRVLPVKSGHIILSKHGQPQRIRVTSLKPNNKYVPETIQSTAQLSRYESAQIEFGPWAPKNVSVLIGDAGQHLACYELARRGIRCATNVLEGAPYDVIGDFGSGRLFTVQVKSCASPVMQGNSITPGYHFRFADCDRKAIDLFAFVALDRKLTMFVRNNDKQTKNKLISEHEFIQTAETVTRKTLLDFYSQT